MNKTLYGLKQAPRVWFYRLTQTLHNLGFTSPLLDTSLFMLHKGSTHIFVLICMDDIIVTNNHLFAINTLINYIFMVSQYSFHGTRATRLTLLHFSSSPIARSSSNSVNASLTFSIPTSLIQFIQNWMIPIIWPGYVNSLPYSGLMD